jgi:pimeloyl-ACP methyl ester carboxylesterase
MGYGETSKQFDELGRAVPCRDTDIIEAMLGKAGEPVNIVAHSYGAAVALEYATACPQNVASVIAIEPPSFHLLRSGAFPAELKAVEELAADVIQAETMGNSRSSARQYMSFWLVLLRWMLAPRRLKASVIETMPKVAFEFSLLSDLSGDTTKFADFDRPTTLVSGSHSPRPAHAVIETLLSVLPNCRQQTIDRAGHMSPFTHRNQVLELVEQHLLASA